MLVIGFRLVDKSCYFAFYYFWPKEDYEVYGGKGPAQEKGLCFQPGILFSYVRLVVGCRRMRIFGAEVAPDRIWVGQWKRGRVKAVVMVGQLIENKPLPQWLAST
jgi:hypothetical protein